MHRQRVTVPVLSKTVQEMNRMDHLGENWSWKLAIKASNCLVRQGSRARKGQSPSRALTYPNEADQKVDALRNDIALVNRERKMLPNKEN